MDAYQEINERIINLKSNLEKDFVVRYKDVQFGLDIVNNINNELALTKIEDTSIYVKKIKEVMEKNEHYIYNKALLLGLSHGLMIVSSVSEKSKKLIKIGEQHGWYFNN